ncbi:MAG: hypothetical protein QW569_02645 [Candidatus Bathyarchaeia archaeon]|nr:hypothetical protein [Candidatus Bathyarchaeota archaeon]
MGEAVKKISLEDIGERIAKLKELTETSLSQIEDLAKKKPVETMAMSFAIGIVLGLILGAAIAKR